MRKTVLRVGVACVSFVALCVYVLFIMQYHAKYSTENTIGLVLLFVAFLVTVFRVQKIIKDSDNKASDNKDSEVDDEQHPLHKAVERGDADMVRHLLADGYDADDIDEKGRTALMKAENEQVIEQLINAGADVNVKDEDGSTALMWAAKQGHTEIIQLLKDAGANEER